MFFSAKYSNPLKLLRLFKMVEDISSEVTFHITSEGIFIKNMDDLHVSLISISIDCDDFESYNYNNNKEFIDIGINMATFCKVLNACDRVDTVEFKLDSYNTDNLIIQFDNENRVSEYSLRLINTEYTDITVNDIDYKTEIEIDMRRLTKLFQELDIVDSDTVTFTMNAELDEGSVCISSEGDSSIIKTNLKHCESSSLIVSKKLKIKTKEGDDIIKTVATKIDPEFYVYPFKESFTIEYSRETIKKIIKLNTITSKTTIGISPSTPISFLSMLSNNSYVQYYVAPKV